MDREEEDMEKHLLVTVSEDLSRFCGVRFVGNFFSSKEGLKLTLFYTAPKPPRLWEGERTLESTTEMEQQAKKSEAKGRKALSAASKELVKLGFHDEQIETKLQVRQFSKVMDIIQEGERGLYDAVVLGRRGLSWLEESFDESVSKGVLEKRVTFPLWVCRKPRLERKNVMVCVDGSDAAYRMVDHVGFMLGRDTDHEVTLLTIQGKGEPGRKASDEVLSQSREHLLANGFPGEKIQARAAESGSITKTILQEARAGQFAVVAVGRTGAGQGLLRRIFMGSVSTSLFKDLEEGTLWICQ
jgi:nucleotide-binding universal stress UspA family protein